MTVTSRDDIVKLGSAMTRMTMLGEEHMEIAREHTASLMRNNEATASLNERCKDVPEFLSDIRLLMEHLKTSTKYAADANINFQLLQAQIAMLMEKRELAGGCKDLGVNSMDRESSCPAECANESKTRENLSESIQRLCGLVNASKVIATSSTTAERIIGDLEILLDAAASIARSQKSIGSLMGSRKYSREFQPYETEYGDDYIRDIKRIRGLFTSSIAIAVNKGSELSSPLLFAY